MGRSSASRRRARGDEADGREVARARRGRATTSTSASTTRSILYGSWIPQRLRRRRRRASSASATRRTRRPILERYVPRMLGEAWGSMKARYMFAPDSARRGRDVPRPRAVQRPHERAAEHRHRGRVLRPRRRGDEPEERAVQLGQRALARARARLRDPALEEPRAALVHRGALRVRDDDPPPRVAARARPRALPRAQAQNRSPAPST